MRLPTIASALFLAMLGNACAQDQSNALDFMHHNKAIQILGVDAQPAMKVQGPGGIQKSLPLDVSQFLKTVCPECSVAKSVPASPPLTANDFSTGLMVRDAKTGAQAIVPMEFADMFKDSCPNCTIGTTPEGSPIRIRPKGRHFGSVISYQDLVKDNGPVLFVPDNSKSLPTPDTRIYGASSLAAQP